MGSSACTPKPKKKTFPAQAKKSKPARKTEISEKQLDENYLQGLHLIWFDPKVNSAENSKYKKDLDNLFKTKNYANSKKALNEALEAVQDIPIIVISCGGKYEEIGELVENSSQVIMIAIFCSNMELHQPKLKQHIKIAAVINTFSNLEEELRDGYKNYIRFSYKFLDNAEEQTFLELKDQQKILDGQGMKGIFFQNESNITYPLYYKPFNFGEEDWQDSLKRILLASCNDNLCCPVDREDLLQRIKELSEDRSPENVISAYTRNGIYQMFNRAFRKGKRELLDLFRLFGFALRGSMGLLGEFINPEETLFRGLTLKPEHMKRWDDNLGNVVLLNGYTSTSLDKGLCVTGAFKGNCLMEFRFTKEVQIFEDSLNVFNKLWSGYYSPVDIHKLSAFPGEREILFPPFYPIRIQEITPPNLHPDGIFHIILLVPTYINIGMEGGYQFKYGDGDYMMKKLMARAQVERLTILLENEQMTKVDLGAILSNCQWNERKGIFRALRRNTHVQYLDLSNIKIRIDELWMLFPLDSPQKALKNLDLACNQFGNEGAKIVALNLKFIPHLERLNLGNNCIGDEGFKYLAVNLKFVTKLSRLILSGNWNYVGDEGIICLFQHLECLPNLWHLDLRSNLLISQRLKEKMRQFAKVNEIKEIYI